MYAISNNLNQIAVKANTLGFVDIAMLKEEIYKLNQFQSQIERAYLNPDKSDLVWEKDLPNRSLGIGTRCIKASG